jgi:hypothetical protein
MTDQDLSARRMSTSPAEQGGAARAARHREIGLASVPDERFDAFARQIVERTGVQAAMVNLVGERMYFAGSAARELKPGETGFLADPGREMALDHGYCPHVVERRLALPLDDVYAYPRFAGNSVVDQLGVRAYLGAPLIDEDGTVLGTVCAIDPSPHSEDAGWADRGLETIKQVAQEVVGEIRVRRQVTALIKATTGPVMVTSGPQLEVLYANRAHEYLFGTVPELGVPAAQVFAHLAAAGVTAAVQQVLHSGTPAVTAPVPLADERRILFAVVPAQVPGHRSVQLTLGVDAEADTAIELASDLSDNLTKLCQ